MAEQTIKAVAMLSGGLDSTLAARLILDQGIVVTGLHFRTGFSYHERNRVAGRGPVGPSDAEKAAAALGIPLEVISLGAEYRQMVLHPRYGYGSGMNPCVDCRILLLRRAKEWMEEHGYHFVITGEVVGQRPKSQMRPSLNTVERESGLRGYLLRPLSAKLLPPTVPEQLGWVDRDRLLAIGGRGRKQQIALAERYGLHDYPQPSGGCCYLIDQTYSRRLRDFLAHEGEAALTDAQAQLLAVGRHFRLPTGRKVIVGRHERENEYLETCEARGLRLTTPAHPGPTTLLPEVESQPPATEEEIALAARLTAGYSDGRDRPAVDVEVRRGDDRLATLTVVPLPRVEAQSLMV